MVQNTRRNVLKTIGGTFAGAIGLTVIASRARAAKSHAVEVFPASDGDAGSYEIIIPDPNPNFMNLESGDSVDRQPGRDRTIWSGFVQDGVVTIGSDDAEYNNVSGRLTNSDITINSGNLKVKKDGSLIYP
ncbi:hypothetical protein ACFQL7_27660 [Halocatena marina]|uniref:Uncharacterized protein n=2 Tax=Halocatena marina TaxID=2934937 RepID=A0ABD5YYC7_9EURY